MCSFEWIGLHFKAIFRRFAGGKSRGSNAEVQLKPPKWRFCALETHSDIVVFPQGACQSRRAVDCVNIRIQSGTVRVKEEPDCHVGLTASSQ